MESSPIQMSNVMGSYSYLPTGCHVFGLHTDGT